MKIIRSLSLAGLGIGVALVACKSNNISETTNGGQDASTCVAAGQASGMVTAKGNWQGNPIPQADVVAVHPTPMQALTDAGTAYYVDELDLLLTSYESACGWDQAGRVQPGFEQLEIGLVYETSTPGSMLETGGTYTSGSQGAGIAVGGQIMGSSCAQTPTYVPLKQVQSGTVMLSLFSSTEIQGTFDVTTAASEHLTGTFDTFPCSAVSSRQNCCTP